MSANTEGFQVSGLRLQIGGRTLMHALNWQIEPGQCWCVIGPNGAGKSTLMRALAGVRVADAGSIRLQGTLLADWSVEALARQRAYLAQGRHDAFGYSVLETVLTARHPYHGEASWESEADFAAAYAALSAMDVADLAQRDVRSLSGGERQRVAIAATLAQDTPYIFLDEPANTLDLAHQMHVMVHLDQLCQQQKKAIVMVSHDLNLAQRIASHALLLMGNGEWRAGLAQDILQPDLLSLCLGYPIEEVRLGERRIFIAAEYGVSIGTK